MDRIRAERSAGFTFAELLMGLIIFTIAAVVLGSHVSSNFSSTKTQQDRVFAYTKAQAILAEIHAYVDRGEVEAAIDLDILDDGVTPKPALTITTDTSGNLVLPDHPVSGNYQRDTNWVWSRQISVRPFSGLNNRSVRYVTVRIFKRDQSGNRNELATLSSVVNSVGSAFPTTQVFDVYLLAVENIPGWWVYMEAIIPFVESAITDLENRNPGLSLRTHWITKAGFGRNRAYRPATNEVNDSLQPVGLTYFYPGKMPAGSASTYYYVPDLINARMMIDGNGVNGYDANTNPYPYALADFYNHSMRYPRAKAFHDARVAAVQQRRQDILTAQAGGLPVPDELDDMSEEPPLQVLLEQMNSEPENFRHSLLINLHGELMPMPSIRNYSDPAKDPLNLPGVRVVTHPEELRTQRPPHATLETKVRLRVYAYHTDPNTPQYPRDRLPADRPIALQIMDVDLTDSTSSTGLHSNVTVWNVPGGVAVPQGSTLPAALDYSMGHAKFDGDPTIQPGEMYYEARFVDPGPGQRKFTLLLLHRTPLTTPLHAHSITGDWGGLNNNPRSRLYGLEYVPSCAQATDFSVNLARNVADGPKNTARWVITLPEQLWDNARFTDLTTPPGYFDPRTTSEPDQMITVRTRIWDPSPDDQNGLPADPLETGTWPMGAEDRSVQPDNFSETYAWWTDSVDDVPVTERAQFIGDPRHNPYRDLGHSDPDFPDGYNWFHDSLTNNGQNARADFPAIARAWNRWNGGLRQDVPRSFELLRTGLTTTRSLYTTLTGYSYYYMGYGNEIGYDGANGYGSSIPLTLDPWGYGMFSVGNINNITGRWVSGLYYSRCYVIDLASWTPDGYEFLIPWLGEVYSDRSYGFDYGSPDYQGLPAGNLGAAGVLGDYMRYPDWACHDISKYMAWGHVLGSGTGGIQRTSTRGCVSFFNNRDGGGHFNHHFSGGTGNLVGAGVELRDNYGFPLPSSVSITRPFTVNTGGNDPPEYWQAPYTGNRFSASILEMYYNHPNSSYTGSGLVQLENPAQTDAGFIVVNGLAQTTTVGTSVIAKFCLLSMFQSFFELGNVGVSYRIKQLPRVEIKSPTDITELSNPPTIDIKFSTEWLRWDGQRYAQSFASTFAENESEIDYVLYYSRDGGRNWLYMLSPTPLVAELGRRPTDPTLIRPDSATGDETYTWLTPALAFPEGSYLIRVEAHRRGQELHYAHHQAKIYIER